MFSSQFLERPLALDSLAATHAPLDEVKQSQLSAPSPRHDMRVQLGATPQHSSHSRLLPTNLALSHALSASVNLAASPQSGLLPLSRPLSLQSQLFFPVQYSQSAPRVASTVVAPLRYSRAPHQRFTQSRRPLRHCLSRLHHSRRLISELRLRSSHLKSERLSLMTLTPRRKSERRSQWTLKSRMKECTPTCALNPRLLTERCSSLAFHPHLGSERRSSWALKPRCQSGRSLPSLPPTGTRRMQTPFSSCHHVRGSACRPATRSRDLLPTSSCTCGCAVVLCTDGATF